MAGNVKEWCAERRRRQAPALHPRRRLERTDLPVQRHRGARPLGPPPTLGVRLVKNLGPVGEARAPVAGVYGDPKSVVPVGDAGVRGPQAASTRTNGRHSTPASRASTRARRIGGRRRSASTPPTAESASPPICSCRRTRRRRTRPSSSSQRLRPRCASSQHLDLVTFEFIVRSGRAVLYPVYKGTFDGGGGRAAQGGAARHHGPAGQGLLPRGRLPRDPPGNRQGEARLLQPEPGRLLRPDPSGAGAPHQGGGVCGGRSALQLPARDPARQLHAAGEGTGVARPRARRLPGAARGAGRFFELLGTPPEHKKLSRSKAATCRTTCALSTAKCSTGSTNTWAR